MIPGELFALGAAGCWSASSVPFTFASRAVGAPAVNAFKTTAAAVVLGLAVGLAFGPGAYARFDTRALVYLLASGVIGLSVTDTLLFLAYTRIGPRLAFLVFATSPIFAAFLAWVCRGEALGPRALLGMCLTVGGVLLVSLARREDGVCAVAWGGAALAALAALGMAVATVLAKEALVGRDTPLLFAAHGLRMAAGAAGLLAAGAFLGRLPSWPQHFLRDRRVLAAALLGTALGPVTGVAAFLYGITHTPETGVALTLASTTPVLVIPFTWVFHGDRPGGRALAGAALAVAGVAVLFGR